MVKVLVIGFLYPCETWVEFSPGVDLAVAGLGNEPMNWNSFYVSLHLTASQRKRKKNLFAMNMLVEGEYKPC